MTIDEFARIGRALPADFYNDIPGYEISEFEALLDDARAAASAGTGRLVGPHRTHQWDFWLKMEHKGRTVGRVSLCEWRPDRTHADGGEWIIIGMMMVVMTAPDEVAMVWFDGDGRRAAVYTAADGHAMADVMRPLVPAL